MISLGFCFGSEWYDLNSLRGKERLDFFFFCSSLLFFCDALVRVVDERFWLEFDIMCRLISTTGFYGLNFVTRKRNLLGTVFVVGKEWPF